MTNPEAINTEEPQPAIPYDVPWRVGRKLGRTIYAQYFPEPSDTDQLLGMMDARGFAEHIVVTHNADLMQRLQVHP